MRDHAVMLSPFVALRVNSAKHLEAQRERPFAAAQGDIVRELRLMPIGRNELRPYMVFDRLPGYFVNVHYRAPWSGGGRTTKRLNAHRDRCVSDRPTPRGMR
jgi:hypothetical protein